MHSTADVRPKIYDSITEAMGGTPLVRVKRVTDGAKGVVLSKLENFNPLWSVKDRIGVSMIEDAEEKGKIQKGTVIIEATSGNTGIGLAFVCAARGYKLIVTMPESMSLERRRLLKAFGAELHLTPADKGMNGAVARAEELFREMGGEPKAFIPQQFKNPSNPAVHRKTTAEEIWKATNGAFDIFVSGVGTGGTITGCSEVFKERNPSIQIVAVEPTLSNVLTQHLQQDVPADKVVPNRHKIQGIGAGFIPGIVQDGLKRAAEKGRKLIDEIVQVTDDESFEMARRLAKEEGMLCGISCGAAMAAGVKLAKRPENAGKTIVVILPDLGERYLSTALYPEA
ncbi:cysteine synthase A [Limnoglobus roseus]|uniref:Cysteine synthase n=1 Tax=Limnoglobus roseus TaxID=2598579 RepID=A0A5C1AD96_9BACT|nr:cysteine synthase A [Limnoglobus roseus]QEL17329.1 cysteine synthase A [Limnoglobus roseus]